MWFKTAKEMVNTISNGTKLLIDVSDEYLNPLKTACEFTIESKKYNMEKHQFEPFDKVLVRDFDDDIWHADIFSHYIKSDGTYSCTGVYWNQCIPYNEQTAHLIGTNKPYNEPEPKVWYVEGTDNGIVKKFKLTQTQFESFIKGLPSVESCVYSISRIKD